MSATPFVVLVVLSSEWFQRGYVEEYENIWEDLTVSGQLIVVYINHRVGMLGFLDAGIEETPGNLGIHDAYLALSWIAEHIQAFRGDPNSLVGLGHGSGAYIASLDLFAPTWHRRRFFKRLILQGLSPASLLPRAAPNFLASVAASLQCDRHGDSASSVACISDLPLSQIYRGTPKEQPFLFIPSCSKLPVRDCDDMLQELPVFLRHREIMCGFSQDDGYRLFDRFVMEPTSPVPKEPSAVFDHLQRFFTGMPPKHEFKSLSPEAQRVLNRSDLEGFRNLVVDMVLRCPLLGLVRNAVLKGTLAYMYAAEVPTVVFEPALTRADIIDFAKTG
ncbi:hypothetical protein V5799_026761 [Amblyomma americanum]|uniref:Carboxylesterase type B domain-containing protein n=1 Tax=Amblyomma americanum TaxID=6943 RepID=A0AAQ4DHN2_AMBAM